MSQVLLAADAAPRSARPAAALSAAAAARFLDRPGGRIAYDDIGSGALVVMVPGLGDLRGEYRFLAPRVAAAGHRVVTMDLRGHGQSSAGWDDYSTTAVGGDVAALVEHLDAGPAALIGTSMGAGAAVVAAAAMPERTSAVIGIGPFVRDVPLPLSTRAVLAVALNVAFTGPWGPAAWGAYYRSLYPSEKPGDFGDYTARLVANLKEPGRFAALRAMLRASKADVEPQLARVRAPALVMMGTRDPDFPDPAAEARLVAERLRGEVALVEGAGHYPHAEVPDAAAPIIIDFLDRNRLR